MSQADRERAEAFEEKLHAREEKNTAFEIRMTRESGNRPAGEM